jgi:putative flippase GtrA
VTPPAAGLFRMPRLRSAGREEWLQLLRFCCVGSSGYVVNLAVFTLLLALADTGHIAAAIGAFCVAWCSNFALNRHWTFRGTGQRALRQGGRYLLVSLLALEVNIVLLDLLVELGAPAVPAQAAAIAAVTPVSFLLNRRWTFR